jgi:tRNA(fMet)-specific endonuclease VapC
MWMLDTNICSYILRQRPPSVLLRFQAVGPDQLSISSVVLAELHYGCSRHPQGDKIRRDVDDFASRLRVLDWDEAAARSYGDLRAYLEAAGTPIGAMDTMIAAHALSQKANLVTNNERHFERVPELMLENWV